LGTRPVQKMASAKADLEDAVRRDALRDLRDVREVLGAWCQGAALPSFEGDISVVETSHELPVPFSCSRGGKITSSIGPIWTRWRVILYMGKINVVMAPLTSILPWNLPVNVRLAVAAEDRGSEADQQYKILSPRTTLIS